MSAAPPSKRPRRVTAPKKKARPTPVASQSSPPEAETSPENGRSPSHAPVARRPRERHGFAVARDGTALYYRVHEPEEGPTSAVPVIFTDGIGCDGYVWKYLEPELVNDRSIVHWHYRGHGRTPIPRDPSRVTISDCADDLIEVMNTVGVDRAVLAGHSMGVQVCLEAWRRAGGRVAGLVLMCGSYGMPLRTFKGSRALEDVLPLVRFAIHRVPRLVTAFWRSVVPTDLAYKVATLFEINGELIQREDFFPYLEHVAEVDVRLFVDMLTAAGRHTARELLPRIDVPTLIVAGGRDSMTPLSLSEEMHREIRGSELLVVADGSHTAPIEQPALVTEVVARFVRRIPS